jgi:hypothetical protein
MLREELAEVRAAKAGAERERAEMLGVGWWRRAWLWLTT